MTESETGRSRAHGSSKTAMVVGGRSIGWLVHARRNRVLLRAEAPQVFCVDRNGSGREETRQIIAAEGCKLSRSTADAANALKFEAMVAHAVHAYCRVACSTTCRHRRDGTFPDVSEASWDHFFVRQSQKALSFLPMSTSSRDARWRRARSSISRRSPRSPISHLLLTYATTKAAMNQDGNDAVEYRRK